jgi:hypothetical protein
MSNPISDILKKIASFIPKPLRTRLKADVDVAEVAVDAIDEAVYEVDNALADPPAPTPAS